MQVHALRRPQSAIDGAMAFATRHPDEMNWLAENMASNDFAASLARQLDGMGSLTPNQIAALRDKTAALRSRAAAPVVNVGEIEARFAVARGNGVKKPAMRLDTFVFKAAGDRSANPGAIYVTTKSDDGEGVYLGKVMGGKFLRDRECTDDQQTRIVAAASNPAEAAKAYGMRTGNCSICGRELTAEESIERFIGPICLSKFGL